MKKFRVLVLFVLIFSLMFSYASARMVFNDDCTYSFLSDGTVQIENWKKKTSRVTIPAEIDGVSVTSIGGSAFGTNQNLREVILPSTLRHLEDLAFHRCDALYDLVLPDGLQSIGPSALPGKTLSGRIVIPQSVEFFALQLGARGEDLQVRLMSADAAAHKEYADASGQYLYRLLEDGSAEINLYTGTDVSVSVPDMLDGHAVTRIGSLAFVNQRNIETVTLPQGITRIGSFAFKECDALTSITIPEGVTYLGNGAFDGCYSLTAISLPASLVQMGANPFSRCFRLEEIVIPYENDRYYFADYLLLDLEELSIVAALDGGLNSSVVCVPEGIRAIGPAAFTELRLTYTALPEGLESIGAFAFYGVRGSECYVLPESLNFIGREGIPSFPSKTIRGSEGSYGHAWALKNESVFIEWADRNDASGFSCELLEDGTVQITSCSTEAEVVVIPQMIEGRPVSSIGELAFCLNTTMKIVVIPEGVTHIGAGAFDRCSALLYPSLPDSLRTIEERAFGGCESLELLNLPAGLEFIADDAFLGCADDCYLYADEGSYAYDWAVRVYSE